MRPRIKAAVRRAAAFAVRLVAQAVMLARPRPGAHAVVYGKSAALTSEENALVVAVELARSFAGTVTLLSDDPPSSRRYLDQVAAAMGASAERIVIDRFSLRSALRELARSRLLFHTASFLAAPRPRGRRLHLALAHGTSPKWPTMSAYRATMHSSAYCATAREWGREIMRAFAMPASAALLTGNPRQDMMFRGPGREGLAALGFDPDRPAVLWMPTYRAAETIAITSVRDGVPLSERAADIAAIAQLADLHGVQLAVKPHPRDASSFDAFGMRVIGDDEIWGAGMTLYQFIGSCDAMISDYSSVWVDYLATGRSVGLYAPDLDAYAGTRGLLTPALGDVAGRLLLRDNADIGEFFEAITRGEVFRADALATCRQRIGYIDVPAGATRTETLLGEIDALWRSRWPREASYIDL